MEIFNVSKNIIVASTSNLCGNITCINSKDGLIFADTGLMIEKVKKFRQSMEKKFDKAIHYHKTANKRISKE